jgi:hypothetical protein
VVCSKRLLGTERLERESVVPSQAPSDREPFESVVPPHQRTDSPLTAFEEELDTYINGRHDLSMGVRDLEDESQMPGTFPQDEAVDDDSMCAFM